MTDDGLLCTGSLPCRVRDALDVVDECFGCNSKMGGRCRWSSGQPIAWSKDTMDKQTRIVW